MWPESIPTWLRWWAATTPNLPALRDRKAGRWRRLTYLQFHTCVATEASRLLADGVRPGDRVGLWSRNRAEWLIADYAIMAVGAITVPLHADIPRAVAESQLAVAGSNICFADDIRPLDGLADQPLRPGPPLPEIKPDIPATLLFTSGTTGEPKGVLLSHRNMMYNAVAAQSILPFGPGGVMLNFLPFSHIYARVSDGLQSLIAGSELVLADSAATVRDDLKEVRPHFFRAVPRFYEKLVQENSIRDHFGPHTRRLYVGGAPVAPHVEDAFERAGFPLIQGYGLTETSPTVTVNRDDRRKPGTAGLPLPETEIRIADDGEVLVRGPSVMLRYWNDEELTSHTMRDGWLHTGDLGKIDGDGFLHITGRRDDMIVLSTGRKLMPTLVEADLTAGNLISQAVVVGTGRPYPAALVFPCDPSSLDGAIFAEAASLLVDRPPWERVRKLLILSRPLSQARGELTVSMKPRRWVIATAFADDFDRLYSSSSPTARPAVSASSC